MRSSILTFLLVLTAFAVQAAKFPEAPNPPALVNDFTNTLSSQEIEKLENKLLVFEDSSSTQIAIVIISTLDGYDISQYAFELGRKWGIGQKDMNNGALLLVALDDREVFIATGYGLEGAIPDALAKRIVEQQILPNFKNGNYFRGLDEATDVMIKLARGEYTAEDVVKDGASGFWSTLLTIILFIAFVIFLRVLSVRRYARLNNLGFWAAWFLLSQVDQQRGKWKGWRSHGSGSGYGGGSSRGFGGFGGGSFGGGGAGGRW